MKTIIEFQHDHYGEDLAIFRYHPESLTYPEHFHRSFELIICRQGHTVLNINQTYYSLTEGDVALILPFQTHFIETPFQSRLDILIFSPEYTDDFYTKTEFMAFESPVISMTNDQISQLHEPLFVTDSYYYRKSALYQVLHIFEQNTELVKVKGNDGLIAQLLIYIENNFQNHLLLEQLSAALGYSSVYVSKLIADRLKSTFPKLLNSSRVNHACFLLKNTSHSITEISDKSGFQNSRTFNRNFKSLIGMTPKAYRQKHMNL
ncbi:helix-turn-helix transcriptional regulator [Amphibacillus indicireducens]|uniref:AraC family transcriptional regulator n=1 Tax=Amphibacillus indicireducens TaxID=1076330 RepID=A0ABP7VXD8_9BACI